MATLTLAATVTQVRPWPAGGAWNNVAVVNKTAQKSTTYGVTLGAGYAILALACLNQWMNGSSEVGVGTATSMAQERLHALGLEASESGGLSTAQTGAGVSTNVIDRGGQSGAGQVVIVTTVGATPTCTYQLEGSPDGTTWSPLSSADSGTPTAFSTATFTITTATTTTRIINPAATAARFVRLTYSANTNVTNTATVQVGT
jgi:hypothetical protein